MRMEIESVERVVGPLPSSYRDWVERGIPEDEGYELYSVEWMPVSHILGTEIAPDEPFLPGIFPVATYHGLSLWCIDNQNGGRVILCPHDDYLAELYAPNVDAWICRSCMEMATDFPDEIEEIQRQLIAWGELLRETSTGWGSHLLELAKIEPTDIEGNLAVIAKSEVDSWVERELGEEYSGSPVVQFLEPQD